MVLTLKICCHGLTYILATNASKGSTFTSTELREVKKTVKFFGLIPVDIRAAGVKGFFIG